MAWGATVGLIGLYGHSTLGAQLREVFSSFNGLIGLYGHPGAGGLSSVHSCGEVSWGFSRSKTPSMLCMMIMSNSSPECSAGSTGATWEGDGADTKHSRIWSTSSGHKSNHI